MKVTTKRWKKWIWILAALVFYLVTIRWFLLGYLYEKDALGWYESFIEAFNRAAGVGFGTGPHPLEEYRQRTDIFLFQVVLMVVVIKSIRYVFQTKGRLLLLTINVVFLVAVFSLTELILNTDEMQKEFGSHQHWELDRKISSLSKSQQNSFGFRDIERQKKKVEGVFRIAVLGDSFVYGAGLADPNDIWSHVLEKKIRTEYGDSVEVLSWGRNGWSTYDEFRFLKGWGSAFDIDYLVIGVIHNDPHIPGISMPRRNFVWHKLAQQLPFFKNTIRFLSNYLNEALYHLPYFSDWGNIGWRNALYSEENLRAYENMLGEFKNHLESHEINYVFVSTPTLGDSAFRKYYELLLNVFDRKDIRYLDLYPKVVETFGHYNGKQIRQKLWANPVNGHPGQRLTMLYAESVFEYFQTNRLIPQEVSSQSINTVRIN